MPDTLLQLYRTVYKADHPEYQYSDYLSTVRCYPHRRLQLISVVAIMAMAMAYMLTQAALANIANIAAERTGSVFFACLAQ